jgi:hypothetical protein
MIPHPDGGRHCFSGEKCRSKISKWHSATFMGFHQRFPKDPTPPPVQTFFFVFLNPFLAFDRKHLLKPVLTNQPRSTNKKTRKQPTV